MISLYGRNNYVKKEFCKYNQLLEENAWNCIDIVCITHITDIYRYLSKKIICNEIKREVVFAISIVEIYFGLPAMESS